MALPDNFFDDLSSVEESTSPGSGIDRYEDFFNEAAETYNVSKSTLKAIAKEESGGDPMAVSSAGAMGIMQFMPGTAAEMGLDDPFDPRSNILAGAKYFKQNLDRLGSEDLAIAAHKAGPGAVEKAGGVPQAGQRGSYDPYVSENTSDYVNKVLSRKSEMAEQLGDTFFDDIFVGETEQQDKAGALEEQQLAPGSKFLPPQETAVASSLSVTPEFAKEEAKVAEEKSRALTGAENFGKGLVGATRALASQLPTLSVGIFTFPTRVFTGAAAAFQDFVNTGDPEQMVEGFKQGFSGERDAIGASAVKWDQLAEESKDIISGRNTSQAQAHQTMLADMIANAAMITWGGHSFAKQYPGIEQSVKQVSSSVVKKAKEAVKVNKKLKLTPTELKNVQQVHQGFGGKTVANLSPREKMFYDAMLQDAERVHLAAIKTGKIEKMMWPWEKFGPKTPKVKVKGGKPTGPASLEKALITAEPGAPKAAAVDLSKVDDATKAWMQKAVTGKAPPVPAEKISPKKPVVAEQLELFPVEQAKKPPTIPDEIRNEVSLAEPTKLPEEIAGMERRVDVAKRKKISEMTLEEARRELAVDELTGLGSRRAYTEVDKKPVQGIVDLDGLKWINDNMGHESGDMLLKVVSEGMRKEGIEAYRTGGDEITFQGDNADALNKSIDNVYGFLKDKTISIETPDGNVVQVKGAGFSYGLSKDADPTKALGAADDILREQKIEREKLGLRSPRGEQPPGTTVLPKKPPQRKSHSPSGVAPKPKVKVKVKGKPVKIVKKTPVAAKGVPRPKPKAVPETEPTFATSEAGALRIPEKLPESAKKKVPPVARKAYNEMVESIQTKLFEGARIRNTVKQKLSPTQREALPFLIEGTKVPKELGRADLEKVFGDKATVDKMRSVAGTMKKHYRKRWKETVESEPDMGDREIENYINRLWDIPKNERAEAVSWFKTRNPHLKKRLFRTLEAGIKKGYKPKTTDAAKLMEYYDEVAVRTTENKKFLKTLMGLEDESGMKLIQLASKAPHDWKYTDHPLLNKAVALPSKEVESIPMDVRKAMGKDARKVISYIDKNGKERNLSVPKSVDELKAEGIETKSVTIMPIIKAPVKYHPDLAPMMEATFGRRWGGGGFAGKVLQIYETANAIQKKAQLTISLFHHTALGETSLATIGPKKTAAISLNAKKLYRALAKNRYDMFEKMYPVARDAVKHGLTLEAISDVHRAKVVKMLESTEEGLKKVHKILGLPVKGLVKANDLWDKSLWDWYHNNLKLYGYEALTAKYIPKLKNATPESIDKLKKEIAAFINDTYGGQNWERMMTNPKSLQMAQWVLLSPDWTLSTIRQGMSFTGMGALSKEMKGVRAKMGREFWARALLYFGLGVNALNYVLSKADDAAQKGKKFSEGNGKFLWENDPGHKTHLFVGRYRDGSKRYLRWGKQFREVPELIYDNQAMEVSPVTATLKKVGGKASPNFQLFSALTTGHTTSGFKIKTLADEKGWPWVKAAGKYIIGNPLPFSLRNSWNETKEFRATDLAFPSSKGMSYYKTKKLFKYAILKRKLDGIENVFTAAVENDLNAWDIFEQAITEIKAEAGSEISREVRLGKIDPAKTPQEIKALSKEQMREYRKKAMLENWELMLKAARERYQAFLDEQEFMGKELPSKSHVKRKK